MAIQALPDEKALLARVAMGDERAFAILLDGYYRPLGDYVLRLTDSLDIAEEVVQDTFIKVWLQRETLTTIGRFSDYLFIISRNQALNHLRQKARDRIRQLAWIKAVEGEGELDDNSSQTERFRQIIEEAVAFLPPQQQRVYRMAKLQRLRHEEIAQELGISVGTVKKHVKLALRAIRAYASKKIDFAIVLVLMTSLY